MGACNCMSKKTDTTLEVVNEKQDLAPVLSEEKPSLPEVINQLSTVIVQEPLPAKETVEETAQDPNLLVSQAQSLFRAYSARKVYLEFKNKPKPVIQEMCIKANGLKTSLKAMAKKPQLMGLLMSDNIKTG